MEIEIDEAEDGGDAARRRGNPPDRPFVGGKEIGVLDEVADAVAGDDHLRRDQQVRFLPDGLVHGGEDPFGVAGNVPARGVQLGQGDSHGLPSDGLHIRRRAAGDICSLGGYHDSRTGWPSRADS